MIRRCLSTLAGLVVVGGSLAALGPAATAAASAASAAPHTARIHYVRQPGGPLARPHGTRPAVTRGWSNNWSGYVAVGSHTSVSADWNEPAGTCTGSSSTSKPTMDDSFWVGLDGWNDFTVEQIGSVTDCYGKTPSYYTWYEMWPAGPVNLSGTVKPGDKLHGSVTFTGTSTGPKGGTRNDYTLVIQDITQGWTKTIKTTDPSSLNSSAEVIAELPGDGLPFAHYSPLTYTSITANGKPIGDASNLHEIVLWDFQNRPMDRISSLVTGNRFTSTWVRSN